jgi:DNA-directed RNA polymerase specialized sigma24 family protein
MIGRSLNGNSQKDLDEDQTLFDVRFWRAYRLLYFVADRILNDSERAKLAVENCWHSASVRPPHFEYEGAFRSWLIRVLIDEALLLLREKQQTTETKISLDGVLTRRDTP